MSNHRLRGNRRIGGLRGEFTDQPVGIPGHAVTTRAARGS